MVFGGRLKDDRLMFWIIVQRCFEDGWRIVRKLFEDG